ncbi:hypothetical protein G6F43_002016 [Rhizopus delemar]|nr:hypothetical protein G6F43_002016 [Rhizopus delemar]
MPAILLRTVSFIIGWIYQFISSHHHHHPLTPKKATKTTHNQEDEMSNMYFWLQRCSICLDQTYNLCLENCRDQFCKDCFSRYIEETVNQSWGLGVTRIKCPVCQEIISQGEWCRYVSSEIVAKYNKFNQPYRPYSRYCLGCQHSVAPCQSPLAQELSRESRLGSIANDLDLFSKSTKDHSLSSLVDEVLRHFLTTCQKGSTFRIGRIQELYHQIIPVLRKVVSHQKDLYDLASNISKQLVALEIIPEIWKQTQFRHISYFPMETCMNCGDKLCLQCGQVAHFGLSCLEHLKSELMQSTNTEYTSTIQWKLNHTRPCPNCSVMINRDEGCNKVDCLQCGYRFCWRCGSAWTQQKCGFYQCGENKEDVLLKEDENKAELGVPDMHAIDAKRQSIQSL